METITVTNRPTLAFCFLGMAAFGAPIDVRAEVAMTVSVGASFSQTDTFIPADLTPLTLRRDDSDVGPQIAVTVDFGTWLGFEAGWADLGSTSGTAEHLLFCPGGCPPDDPPTILEVTSSAKAFWAAYAPSMERGRWQLSGRVGAARVKREIEVFGPWQSSTETDLLLGVGATYFFPRNVGVRFDLNRFGSTSTTLGISAVLQFR